MSGSILDAVRGVENPGLGLLVQYRVRLHAENVFFFFSFLFLQFINCMQTVVYDNIALPHNFPITSSASHMVVTQKIKKQELMKI